LFDIFLLKNVISILGIGDPCEKDAVDACGNLTPQEREDITAAAQVPFVYIDAPLHNN